MSSALPPGGRELVLAFADDEHLMGQQHTEWIGVAPFLEEDLAFASIGQDELGHAAMLYELITDDVDALALRREPDQYRSCWLVEEPCQDWAEALVRHWLYDAAEVLRWQTLVGSSVPALGEIAARALREEAFHRRHADAMLDALAGSDEARRRIGDAVQRLLPLAWGVFEAPPDEEAAVGAGVATARLQSLREPWLDVVTQRFGISGGDAAEPDQRQRTRRGPHFQALYDRMREVVMIDPGAEW